jgi:hypothetical protein
VQMRVRKSFQEGDTAKPAAMASEGTVQWPALGAVVGPFVHAVLVRPRLSKSGLHSVGHTDRAATRR